MIYSLMTKNWGSIDHLIQKNIEWVERSGTHHLHKWKPLNQNISYVFCLCKYPAKSFPGFFLGKQLSQTADEHGWTRMSPRQTGICVCLRSSAVPRMQIPENIWPGTYRTKKIQIFGQPSVSDGQMILSGMSKSVFL